MKIEREIFFLRRGTTEEIALFDQIRIQIELAIHRVVWPEESSTFIINPTRLANGVVPIKKEFINYLKSKGWVTEKRFELVNGIGAGPIDAVYDTELGMIAVEWETGNISSSHRAINKMATAIIEDRLIAGILVIPIWNLAQYLTDRIGNFEEIEPYFPMWNNLNIKRGIDRRAHV